ncbi:MAG: HU family DNA-binding protein [Gammaproteobacteria bacterium]|jgi:nucleoid DNA-binding protein
MVKTTASNKPTDTVRPSKTRARKTSPEVVSTKVAPSRVSPAKVILTRASQARAAPTRVSPAKASRAKVSSPKAAATKETSKDASKEATKAARKVNPKGSSQAAARLKAIRIKQTKAQIIQTLTEETGLPRKDVAKVMATLATLAKRHVMKRGSGEFSIPELGVKVRRVQRKARMARNPMTGDPVRVPAKTAVKATVLKALKDAVL